MKIFFFISTLAVLLCGNSHGYSDVDCHRNLLLRLAQSPFLLKGEVIGMEYSRLKLGVVKHVWGDTALSEIQIAIFPNEYSQLDLAGYLDGNSGDSAGRYVFVFATKVNDSLFMSTEGECGIVESRGDSVVLDRFFSRSLRTLTESDFVNGMKGLREGKLLTTQGESDFNDTLVQIKKDVYTPENTSNHLWLFFLTVLSVTAIQTIMFLGF